jgi:hypothetical protein
MPDNWEDETGLDPLDASDGTIDTDRDGRDNRSEFVAGTDPNDDESTFVAEIEAGPELKWFGVSGRTYRLQAKAGLSAGPWAEVFEERHGADETIRIPVDGEDSNRVYRLEVTGPP